MTDTNDKLANARAQALEQMESISEMVAKLCAAEDDDAYEEMAEQLAKEAGFIVATWKGGYHWGKPNNPPKWDTKTYDTAEEAWLACCYNTAEEAWLACCDENGLRPGADEARQAIQEDALSVLVRAGWVSPGKKMKPEEFEILLCTGGPAVRIVGDLDYYLLPDCARLECQDWGTPWTEVIDGVDHEALLTYCQVFWFGGD